MPPSVAFEPLTVPQLLQRAATEHGAATAVIFLNCRLTYRELQREVARVATARAHLGVSKDSRVDDVDRVLASHPAVLESATIGVPDRQRGEQVKAFVVLETGQAVAAEALVAFCRENLAAYKVPKLIEFRTELPKSAVVKVLRRQLRDEELTKLERVG